MRMKAQTHEGCRSCAKHFVNDDCCQLESRPIRVCTGNTHLELRVLRRVRRPLQLGRQAGQPTRTAARLVVCGLPTS